MYFLKYETLPSLNSPHQNEFGATLALCWIDKSTETEADLKARSSIILSGWDIISLDESYPVCLEEIDSSRPAYGFFLRAQDNGEHIIFVSGTPRE